MICNKNYVIFFLVACCVSTCSLLAASELVVHAGGDENVYHNQQLTSLLYEASCHGRSEEIAPLVTAGANVSGDAGIQSLAAAVQGSHRPTVRALLRAGADPNAVIPSESGAGWNAVMLAAQDHQRFMLRDIFRRGGYSPSRQYMRKHGLSEDATALVLSYEPRYPAYLSAAGRHLRVSCRESTNEALPDDIAIEILATAYDVPSEMHNTVKNEMNKKPSWADRAKSALSAVWS